MSAHIPEGSRYRIDEPPADERPACTRPVKCNRCYCVFEADDINACGRCPGCQYRWTVETQSEYERTTDIMDQLSQDLNPV